MTFIDWSDADGMIGMLVDFVADERAKCRNDPERLHFVEDVLAQLQAVEANVQEIHAEATIQSLEVLHGSADSRFSCDPVMLHLKDCIDELERVENC